ncbi:MAG: PAS domain-containing protein [Chloroflexi bacterium]|nr:MAG: PAS domain-containing protein [Chloroflexota bacterium]TMG72180.1 MAG: PAS domain-containing protein [Chloroflexota bacterium]
MAELLERAGRPTPIRPDPRETLEPLLDDLLRSLGFEKALVLIFDEARSALVGSFGIGVADAAVREVAVPLTNADDPIVAVLRNGFPQRVPDARVDERLDRSVRDLFATLGLGPFVVAPLRSTAGRPVSGDGKHAPSPGWETRGEWAGVVLLSRASGVTQADVEALVPFGRRAGETLNRQRDVELLRETSEAHAIEKEWLWWMVNGLGDAVLLTDSNNDIILENRRAELLFRASDEDSAGKRRAVWMNNFLFTASLSSWNLERGSATTAREVTLVDPVEGTELIYEVITTPATNYRVGMRGTVSVLKNVTDIRHIGEEIVRGQERLQSAEEEIRIERDRLDLVLRNVPNPIIVVDIDNQIISMNPSAHRLFKADVPTARANQHALANDARFTSFLAQLRLDPLLAKRGEIALTDPKTDERLEMEVSATEIRDSRGAVIAIVSVMQDVGRLRELERRRLEQVLFDSEKLAATGRLAASIAHEINNPLEAVQNALYLLERFVGTTVAGQEYLEIATRETQRMSRILRQMLGFYRQTEALAETDLNGLVQEAESLVVKRLRERGVQIAEELEPGLPKVNASADQLKQVLLNLLLNAADSMPAGGTITVSTQTGAGAETEIVGREAVQLQVRDTGQGIPDDMLGQIFEPFFSTKPGKGTGLGLWVSQGIVQNHGGTMRVRSRMGRGTTFTITLPVKGPSDARAG